MAKPRLTATLHYAAPFVQRHPVQPTARPQVVIAEPAQIVGRSGRVYGTVSEDGRPEMMSIRPMTRPYAPTDKRGVEDFLTGGELLAMGYSPDDPRVQQAITSQSLNAGTQANQVSSIVGAPGGTPTGPAANIYTAQQNQLNAQQSALNAQRNVVSAQQNTVGPSRAVIAAQGNVISTQGRYTSAERDYIAQQQQANSQRLQETQAIQSASRDMGDITAVAQAQNARNALDYQYQLAGLPRPVEVETPTGADQQGLPPGVRPKLQTRAELLQRQSGEAEQLRALKLDQARLAVSLIGTDVEKARQAAARAGLTLDEAQLLVQQAQQEASLAGISAQEASLAVQRAQMPPAPGLVMYTDPQTLQSSWVTPAQRALAEAADQREINLAEPGLVLYTDPYSGTREYVTPAVRDQREFDYQQSLYQQRRAVQYSPSELGSFSDDYIRTLVGEGIVDEATAIAEFMRRGYTEAQARFLVQEVQTTRGGAGGDYDLGNLFGGGGAAAPAAPTAPAAPAAERRDLPNFFGFPTLRPRNAYAP